MSSPSDPDAHKPVSIRRVGFSFARLGVFAVGLWMFLALFSRYHWFLDLFSNFPIFYFWISLASGVVLILLRRWRWTVAAFVLVSINAAQLAPYVSFVSTDTARPEDTIRVMLINVLTSNTDKSAFAELVRRHDPDILCIQEVDDAWLAAIRGLDDLLPHVAADSRPDNFGIALASRWPLAQSEVIYLGDSTVPAILATIATPEGPLQLLDIHTLPPVMAEYAETRGLQLEHAADIAAGNPIRFILVGDLNTTMWSPYYETLIEDSGLVSSRLGKGLMPSYNAKRWYTTLAPVDHILCSRDITMVNSFAGERIGSDHVPIIADVRP